MQVHNPLIVALDRSSRGEILRLADALHDTAGAFKIGLQAFVANGPALVQELTHRGEKIFLDLKVHDIPNTAKNAVAEIASLGVAMTTVHAAGGEEMLRAVARDDLLVLGVTVLTSLDAPVQSVVNLARTAQRSGLRGVVTSPLEIGPIREACGDGFVIVTPGVRPEGSAAGDQRRTTTPAAAIAAGADYIVVGRPITDAPAPHDAALRIIEQLDGARRSSAASSA